MEYKKQPEVLFGNTKINLILSKTFCMLYITQYVPTTILGCVFGFINQQKSLQQLFLSVLKVNFVVCYPNNGFSSFHCWGFLYKKKASVDAFDSFYCVNNYLSTSRFAFLTQQPIHFFLIVIEKLFYEYRWAYCLENHCEICFPIMIAI